MTPLHDRARRSFASDNSAGAHPEVIAALTEANGGHQTSYGVDVYTARLQEVMADHFGPQAEAYPVFNGTGANVISLQALLPRWGGVVCSASAHINTDENGAPERVGALKLMPVETPNGKLTPELIDRQAWGWGFEHRAQPLAVSITQATELGTVYTPDEVAAICSHAHELGMRVHVDGARLANAAASLGVPMRSITTEAGVDVVSFGGTKNGLVFGEAVVVLNPEVDGLLYLRKMDTQLPSKMRFVSAQLISLLEGDLWLRSARHANAMARRLSSALSRLPGVRLAQRVEANGVFAVIPLPAADLLRERWSFHDWDRERGVVRLMCAFDTTEEDVDSFARALAEHLADDSAGPRPTG